MRNSELPSDVDDPSPACAPYEGPSCPRAPLAQGIEQWFPNFTRHHAEVQFRRLDARVSDLIERPVLTLSDRQYRLYGHGTQGHGRARRVRRALTLVEIAALRVCAQPFTDSQQCRRILKGIGLQYAEMLTKGARHRWWVQGDGRYGVEARLWFQRQA